MPIYDYACQSCGRRIELMHGVNASGPGACEQCGGQMRKLLSPPAIVFKGSGWAKKDARSGKAGSSAKSGSDGETSAVGAKTDSDSTAKSESGTTEKATDSSGTKKSAGSGAADAGT
jgi:putative FmdB family regulatory protein